jgi:hypothetical protein
VSLLLLQQTLQCILGLINISDFRDIGFKPEAVTPVKQIFKENVQ